MTTAALERRLVAILAADVVGYSGMVERDEAGALAALAALHREVIEPLLVTHRGRIVKLMGDGAIIEFPSVVAAVRCAAAIQRSVVARDVGRGLSPERHLVLRIGVNLGDVVVIGGDLLGDGVNVAARLEQLCPPGGVLVSGAVHEHLQGGRLAEPLEFVGERRLKNIDRPVRVYRVRLDGEPGAAGAVAAAGPTPRGARQWPSGAAAAAGAVLLAAVLASAVLFARWPPPLVAADPPHPGRPEAVQDGPTLAVVPFENLSGDPTQDYFAVGITQEIVAALSRFRELRVVSAPVSAAVTAGPRGAAAADAQEAGRRLGARYVLAGGVGRAAAEVRVTARLLDARDGAHIWAETYDRPLTPEGLFAVQDEVARRIGAAIGSAWTGAVALTEVQRSRPKPPAELSSYECVLLAFQANASQASDELFRRARACLEATTEREPGYAAAWAMLANTLGLQRFWGTGLPPEEAADLDRRAHLGPRALEAAERAVGLAPDNPLARFALARAYYTTCQRERLLLEAERTLALNPNDPALLGSLGNLLGSAGYPARGRAMAERALALVPTGHPRWWWWVIAKDHYRKGEFQEALEAFQRSYVEQNWLSQLHMAYTLPYLGRDEEARAHVARLLALRPGYTVREADRLYAAWCYEPAYRERMDQALRQAGLPE